MGVVQTLLSSFPKLREFLESQRTMTRTLEKETNRIIPWVFHQSGSRIRSYRSQWDRARQMVSTDDTPRVLRFGPARRSKTDSYTT